MKLRRGVSIKMVNNIDIYIELKKKSRKLTNLALNHVDGKGHVT